MKKLKKASGSGRRKRDPRPGSVRAKILALLAGGNRTAEGVDVRADGRIRPTYPRGRRA